MKTLINTLYSMNLTINERIAALRTHIAQENIQAFIIPSTDPHLSEYVAPHWQSREWISGFTGSAGTVVITAEEAGLWTDSRYFLQAARQIEGTEITLYKEMLPETPSIPTFLNSRLQEGDTVGIDGKMFSAKEVEHLQEALRKSGIHVKVLPTPCNCYGKTARQCHCLPRLFTTHNMPAGALRRNLQPSEKRWTQTVLSLCYCRHWMK